MAKDTLQLLSPWGAPALRWEPRNHPEGAPPQCFNTRGCGKLWPLEGGKVCRTQNSLTKGRWEEFQGCSLCGPPTLCLSSGPGIPLTSCPAPGQEDPSSAWAEPISQPCPYCVTDTSSICRSENLHPLPVPLHFSAGISSFPSLLRLLVPSVSLGAHYTFLCASWFSRVH